jgi:hypothetical protein
MGKYTRYRALPDSAYDPRVTSLKRPFNAPGSTGPQSGIPYSTANGSTTTGGMQAGIPGSSVLGFMNKNVTNMLPFGLVVGVSVRALANNAKRSGLIIQNKDPTNTLNYSLGNDLQALGAAIGPGGAVLFDFTTPPDALYLYSATANLQAVVVELSRTA